MSTELGVSRPAPYAFDKNRIEQFLAFGFIPDPEDPEPLGLLREWSREPRRDLGEVSESALVREGAAAMRASVEECARRTTTSGDQVIFLSGGLDSRTILAALLETFDRSQIVAATFGRPGEQDFDYAALVARAAGVRHETLESSTVEWSTDGLVDSVLARQVPLPFPFGQRYLSYLLHERIGRDHAFWDGLCGDAVGGFRSPTPGERVAWRDAVEEFQGFHLRKGWDKTVSADFDPWAGMPAGPFCSDALMAYPDQLVFGVRQRQYTATRILRGYTICTPFLVRPWLDFMLRVPEKFRNDQYLYQEIQKHAYPRLFSLPTTTYDGGAVLESRFTRSSRGLRRRVLSKAARMGFPVRGGQVPASGANDAVRGGYWAPGPTQDLVRENLTDLAGRGVVDWADPVAFIPGASEADRPSESDITRLLGLELNLKALDRLAARRDGSALAAG
ncbi:asparagine synthase-related protein [Pengzhenrongella frigida]|uniref:Asparagine synthetase domain-containing protein n=1 Tax=Pengzhenrongella frigida TaxID=1259133 RepID=A0A4Q5MWF3_9MICO|nr:asparagine synthase-related protein [Cellulomonas sp. HLT2-17]RYV49918.1 hypothetical protein EUA98_16230 [Cellulomonas sp. HLT2-17]